MVDFIVIIMLEYYKYNNLKEMIMSEYSKCLNCGGEEVYEPEKAMVVCERCGSTFAVKEGVSDNLRRSYSSTYSPDANKNVVVKYTCSTCGAQSVVGRDSEVKRCASCGNTTLTKEKGTTIVPDGIIPFSVSRNKAASIFRTWVGSRKFAPNDLKKLYEITRFFKWKNK